MTTTEIQHGEEKNRSYQVRRQLPGYVDGHDWHARMGQAGVQMRARRDICRVKAGEVVTLVSTSNAGFRGIEGLGVRPGSPDFVHMGSLGAWDIV
jgi:hypothetical protein